MADRRALQRRRVQARLQAAQEEREKLREERAQRSGDLSGNTHAPVDQSILDLGKSMLSEASACLDSSLSPSRMSVQAAPSAPSAKNRDERTARLSVARIDFLEICKTETYSKSTQTSTISHDEGELTDEEEDFDIPRISRLQRRALKPGLPDVKRVAPDATPDLTLKRATQPQVLSEKKKEEIIQSENFHCFLKRSSRIVEAALSKPDIYVDYSATYDVRTEKERTSDLTLNRWFSDDRWSKNRVVTSLEWSQQSSELLVASYHRNEDSPASPDGTCLVWNVKKRSPENIFHFHSPVLSASFARFHPDLIVGGTYSGQIVLWDTRAQKKIPVQQSQISSEAHCHPVYSMRVVTAQNAYKLVSLSTDGIWCTWDLDMLSRPLETVPLRDKRGLKVRATALDFCSDSTNFVVGDEEGHAYGGYWRSNETSTKVLFRGHEAFVTGVSCHSAGVPESADFSHLFLTSSMDWTMKLWSWKESKPLHSFNKESKPHYSCDKESEPLLSFNNNYDNVYDVAWSPVHPALFACVDGTGQLDVWNLNTDTECAAASITVRGNPALSKLKWTPGGMRVSVGDDSGKIWMYDVDEDLAHPNRFEWANFANTLQELKNHKMLESLDTTLIS